MGNPVVHFEVIGSDAQALQSFYKDAFNWQIEEAIENYVMAHPGGEGGINGGIGAAMEGGAGHVTFYVEVPDLEAALSKIEGLGGSTVMEPSEVPEGPPSRCSPTPRATSWVSSRATHRAVAERRRPVA